MPRPSFHRRGSCWLPLFGCLLALLTASPTAVRAQPGPSSSSAADESAYQAAVAEAVTEFGAGRWKEARALFKRAHRLMPNARTLRGMGMCAFEMRMYVPALRELQAALADERRPLEAAQREQVSALIAKASNFIGRYQVTLQPAAAQLLVDGQPVSLDPGGLLFLELGEHRLEATHAGYRPYQLRLRTEAMETQPLSIRLSRVAEPVAATNAAAPVPTVAPTARAESGGSGLAIAGWISVGLAAAAGGAAAYYWYAGEAQYDKLQADCNTDPALCTQANFDALDIGLADALATGFLVGSISAGALGLTLLTVAAFDGEDAGGDTARITLGPGSLQVLGAF